MGARAEHNNRDPCKITHDPPLNCRRQILNHSNHCINDASLQLPLRPFFLENIRGFQLQPLMSYTTILYDINDFNLLKNSANRLLDDVTEGQRGRYLGSLSPLLCELRKSLVRIKC